jgi:hypothetical protein
MLGSFDKDGYLYCFSVVFLGYRIYYMLIQQSDSKNGSWYLSTKLHGVTSQKIIILILRALTPKLKKISVTAEN